MARKGMTIAQFSGLRFCAPIYWAFYIPESAKPRHSALGTDFEETSARRISRLCSLGNLDFSGPFLSAGLTAGRLFLDPSAPRTQS
jgi:hypothetical protein